jgi:hypothetical protein
MLTFFCQCHLFLRAVAAQGYAACIFGDAACAVGSRITSGSDVFCCPNGAFPSQNNNDATCIGGTPAGCAATGKGQPTFETCTATTQTCTSGSPGCKTDIAGQYTGLGILGIGHPLCPAGTTPRLDSMKITSSGTFEYGGEVDYYGSGASGSLRVIISKTPSKCYQLTLPFLAVSAHQWSFKCADAQCPYTLTSSVTCVASLDATSACLVGPFSTASTPGFTTPPRPCAGNAQAITANDGNQYCCGSTSTVPVFGQAGSCTCGQLQWHHRRCCYTQARTFECSARYE